MADSVEDLFCQRLDGYINQWGEEIGYAKLEAILQQRAQDMREMALEHDDVATIEPEDIDGYAED